MSIDPTHTFARPLSASRSLSVRAALAEWDAALRLWNELEGAPPEDYAAAEELIRSAHREYLRVVQAEHLIRTNAVGRARTALGGWR